jgi:hypothetical protein
MKTEFLSTREEVIDIFIGLKIAAASFCVDYFLVSGKGEWT